MKIALLQCNVITGDIAGNSAMLEAASRKAGEMGADICVTPELALCGYPPYDLLYDTDFTTACWQELQNLAVRLQDGPALLVGAPVCHASTGNLIYNAAVLLQEGKAVIVSRKVVLSSHSGYDERQYFTAGAACGIVNMSGWRLGVAISDDAWNDRSLTANRHPAGENPLAEILVRGVDAVINMASVPFALNEQPISRMLAHLASQRRVHVLFVNHVGGRDGLVFAGQSMAFSATGELQTRARSFEEDIVLFDAALAQGVVRSRPSIEESVWKALVMGTRDYARACGFSGAVLGLSGGIDSALVAAIAAEALGAENVLGVLLPSPWTSELSMRLARESAASLGIPTQTLEIEPLMQQFSQSLAPIFSGLDANETEENIQSRIRGVLLMALSNKFGKMLLTTGNKSELAMGYCTLYGDMAGGLAVIADLSKTFVYRLSRWYNEQPDARLIPEESITRPPTAELKNNQCDQDSLPPYETLDAILEMLVERRMSPSAVVEEGYDAVLVEDICRRMRRMEFKRHQATTGIRLSSRSFGLDWRMPIAAKYALK